MLLSTSRRLKLNKLSRDNTKSNLSLKVGKLTVKVLLSCLIILHSKCNKLDRIKEEIWAMEMNLKT